MSPEHSMPSSTGSSQEQNTASISTSFYPLAHGVAYNLVVCSSDGVLFYLKTDIIQATSKNAFRKVLSGALGTLTHISVTTQEPEAEAKPIMIPEKAPIIDAIMHFLYRIPFGNPIPAFTTLEDCIHAMVKYDIEPAPHLVPQNPCYQALLSYAPSYPLNLYAVAAQFRLDHLAALASSHLLAYPISTLSDEMATRIGPIYVKRLLSLHLDRLTSLRSILLTPPEEHLPQPHCGGIEQRKLTSSWAMIAASNAWEARPDISTNFLRASFEPLMAELTCEDCRRSLETHMVQVVTKWADVPCSV